MMERSRLAAYVDGALEPEDAAEVVMHLADNPEDQGYVDRLVALNELLIAAYSAPLTEPLPEPVQRAIRGRPAAAPGAGRLPGWLAYGALAAAAAVLAFVAVPALRGPEGRSALLGVGPVAAGTELHEALEEQPSGYSTTLESGQELTVIASFRHGYDGFCRELEALNAEERTFTRAIACRGSETWDIAVSVSEPIRSAGTDSYLPAADTSVVALDAALDALSAGASLSPEAERSAIDAGWRP